VKTLLATLFIVPVMLTALSPDALAAQATLPDGPARAFIESNCTACHAPGVITSKSFTSEEWTATIQRMITRGRAPPRRRLPTNHANEWTSHHNPTNTSANHA
jgi:hypothetical protein